MKRTSTKSHYPNNPQQQKAPLSSSSCPTEQSQQHSQFNIHFYNPGALPLESTSQAYFLSHTIQRSLKIPPDTDSEQLLSYLHGLLLSYATPISPLSPVNHPASHPVSPSQAPTILPLTFSPKSLAILSLLFKQWSLFQSIQDDQQMDQYNKLLATVMKLAQTKITNILINYDLSPPLAPTLHQNKQYILTPYRQGPHFPINLQIFPNLQHLSIGSAYPFQHVIQYLVIVYNVKTITTEFYRDLLTHYNTLCPLPIFLQPYQFFDVIIPRLKTYHLNNIYIPPYTEPMWYLLQNFKSSYISKAIRKTHDYTHIDPDSFLSGDNQNHKNNNNNSTDNDDNNDIDDLDHDDGDEIDFDTVHDPNGIAINTLLLWQLSQDLSALYTNEFLLHHYNTRSFIFSYLTPHIYNNNKKFYQYHNLNLSHDQAILPHRLIVNYQHDPISTNNEPIMAHKKRSRQNDMFIFSPHHNQFICLVPYDNYLRQYSPIQLTLTCPWEEQRESYHVFDLLVEHNHPPPHPDIFISRNIPESLSDVLGQAKSTPFCWRSLQQLHLMNISPSLTHVGTGLCVTPYLEALTLTNCKLSDLRGLYAVGHTLKYLDISFNHRTLHFSTLHSCLNIDHMISTEISTPRNQFTNAHIPFLPYQNNNKVDAISTIIHECSQLQILNIAGNNLTDSHIPALSQLGVFPAIHTLDLSFNAIQSVISLWPLRSLRLSSINIHNNPCVSENNYRVNIAIIFIDSWAVEDYHLFNSSQIDRPSTSNHQDIIITPTEPPQNPSTGSHITSTPIAQLLPHEILTPFPLAPRYAKIHSYYNHPYNIYFNDMKYDHYNPHISTTLHIPKQLPHSLIKKPFFIDGIPITPTEASAALSAARKIYNALRDMPLFTLIYQHTDGACKLPTSTQNLAQDMIGIPISDALTALVLPNHINWPLTQQQYHNYINNANVSNPALQENITEKSNNPGETNGSGATDNIYPNLPPNNHNNNNVSIVDPQVYNQSHSFNHLFLSKTVSLQTNGCILNVLSSPCCVGPTQHDILKDLMYFNEIVDYSASTPNHTPSPSSTVSCTTSPTTSMLLEVGNLPKKKKNIGIKLKSDAHHNNAINDHISAHDLPQYTHISHLQQHSHIMSDHISKESNLNDIIQKIVDTEYCDGESGNAGLLVVKNTPYKKKKRQTTLKTSTQPAILPPQQSPRITDTVSSSSHTNNTYQSSGFDIDTIDQMSLARSEVSEASHHTINFSNINIPSDLQPHYSKTTGDDLHNSASKLSSVARDDLDLQHNFSFFTHNIASNNRQSIFSPQINTQYEVLHAQYDKMRSIFDSQFHNKNRVIVQYYKIFSLYNKLVETDTMLYSSRVQLNPRKKVNLELSSYLLKKYRKEDENDSNTQSALNYFHSFSDHYAILREHDTPSNNKSIPTSLYSNYSRFIMHLSRIQNDYLYFLSPQTDHLTCAERYDLLDTVLFGPEYLQGESNLFASLKQFSNKYMITVDGQKGNSPFAALAGLKTMPISTLSNFSANDHIEISPLTQTLIIQSKFLKRDPQFLRFLQKKGISILHTGESSTLSQRISFALSSDNEYIIDPLIDSQYNEFISDSVGGNLGNFNKATLGPNAMYQKRYYDMIQHCIIEPLILQANMLRAPLPLEIQNIQTHTSNVGPIDSGSLTVYDQSSLDEDLLVPFPTLLSCVINRHQQYDQINTLDLTKNILAENYFCTPQIPYKNDIFISLTILFLFSLFSPKFLVKHHEYQTNLLNTSTFSHSVHIPLLSSVYVTNQFNTIQHHIQLIETLYHFTFNIYNIYVNNDGAFYSSDLFTTPFHQPITVGCIGQGHLSNISDIIHKLKPLLFTTYTAVASNGTSSQKHLRIILYSILIIFLQQYSLILHSQPTVAEKTPTSFQPIFENDDLIQLLIHLIQLLQVQPNYYHSNYSQLLLPHYEININTNQIVDDNRGFISTTPVDLNYSHCFSDSHVFSPLPQYDTAQGHHIPMAIAISHHNHESDEANAPESIQYSSSSSSDIQQPACDIEFTEYLSYMKHTVKNRELLQKMFTSLNKNHSNGTNMPSHDTVLITDTTSTSNNPLPDDFRIMRGFINTIEINYKNKLLLYENSVSLKKHQISTVLSTVELPTSPSKLYKSGLSLQLQQLSPSSLPIQESSSPEPPISPTLRTNPNSSLKIPHSMNYNNHASHLFHKVIDDIDHFYKDDDLLFAVGIRIAIDPYSLHQDRLKEKMNTLYKHSTQQQQYHSSNNPSYLSNSQTFLPENLMGPCSQPILQSRQNSFLHDHPSNNAHNINSNVALSTNLSLHNSHSRSTLTTTTGKKLHDPNITIPTTAISRERKRNGAIRDSLHFTPTAQPILSFPFTPAYLTFMQFILPSAHCRFYDPWLLPISFTNKTRRDTIKAKKLARLQNAMSLTTQSSSDEKRNQALEKQRTNNLSPRLKTYIDLYYQYSYYYTQRLIYLSQLDDPTNYITDSHSMTVMEVILQCENILSDITSIFSQFKINYINSAVVAAFLQPPLAVLPLLMSTISKLNNPHKQLPQQMAIPSTSCFNVVWSPIHIGCSGLLTATPKSLQFFLRSTPASDLQNHFSDHLDSPSTIESISYLEELHCIGQHSWNELVSIHTGIHFLDLTFVFASKSGYLNTSDDIPSLNTNINSSTTNHTPVISSLNQTLAIKPASINIYKILTYSKRATMSLLQIIRKFASIFRSTVFSTTLPIPQHKLCQLSPEQQYQMIITTHSPHDIVINTDTSAQILDDIIKVIINYTNTHILILLANMNPHQLNQLNIQQQVRQLTHASKLSSDPAQSIKTSSLQPSHLSFSHGSGLEGGLANSSSNVSQSPKVSLPWQPDSTRIAHISRVLSSIAMATIEYNVMTNTCYLFDPIIPFIPSVDNNTSPQHDILQKVSTEYVDFVLEHSGENNTSQRRPLPQIISSTINSPLASPNMSRNFSLSVMSLPSIDSSLTFSSTFCVLVNGHILLLEDTTKSLVDYNHTPSIYQQTAFEYSQVLYNTEQFHSNVEFLQREMHEDHHQSRTGLNLSLHSFYIPPQLVKQAHRDVQTIQLNHMLSLSAAITNRFKVVACEPLSALLSVVQHPINTSASPIDLITNHLSTTNMMTPAQNSSITQPPEITAPQSPSVPMAPDLTTTSTHDFINMSFVFGSKEAFNNIIIARIWSIIAPVEVAQHLLKHITQQRP